MSLTRYRLDKLFDDLNHDLITVSTDVPCYIDEQVSGVWHANNISTIILQKLQLQYLFRSHVYAALEYRFFYNNLTKKSDFSKAHHLSRTAFYSKLSTVDKLLTKIGFFVPGTTLNDDEFTVRLHLFQLYYTLFNGIAEPFTELDEPVVAIITAYQHHFQHQLAPTQKVKLRIFLKIWLKRLQNKCYLSSDHFAAQAANVRGQSFLTEVKQLLAPAIVLSDSELHDLYFFLLSQEMVQLDSEQELIRLFPTANLLTDHVLERLHKQKIIENQNQLDWRGLRHSLLGIHIQYTSFYIEPTTFTDEKKVKFFQDLYPAFDFVIHDFLQYLNEKQLLPLSTASRVNLYFSYMFSLINAIPPELVVDRVHIFVDFSQGCLYTDYVKKSLDAFNHANLVLETALSDHIDLYISDFFSKEVTAPQIIWQDPPTPTDWSLLADMILNLKQRKLNQLKAV